MKGWISVAVNEVLHVVRLAVVGDVQFVEQAVDDGFRHGVGAIAVLLQQLCVGDFEVVQMEADVVVGK